MGKLRGRKALLERLYLHAENYRMETWFSEATRGPSLRRRAGLRGYPLPWAVTGGSLRRPGTPEGPALSWRPGPDPAPLEARATGAAPRERRIGPRGEKPRAPAGAVPPGAVTKGHPKSTIEKKKITWAKYFGVWPQPSAGTGARPARSSRPVGGRGDASAASGARRATAQTARDFAELSSFFYFLFFF